MVIDVDKLSDAELRTKLLEFGFPVMPITGTTRKVMTKKLKLLLENKNKVGSSDGRRSLGRYSSEEESDTDLKTARNKNRRVTMAAPVSSSTTRTTKKIVVEPEAVSSSPKKREIKTTTTTTTSRSQRLVKSAQDEFDTGSDSESDVVASTNKYERPEKYDESFNDIEFKKRPSPIKTTSSSYSRYSPSKSDDFSYTTTKNTSFGASSSPSRYSSVGVSLASEYAADRLNQIRSRLSLNSSGYEPPYSSSGNNVSLEEKDTPFLSNFTKRLSALSSTKRTDIDNRNDMVKEHDSNGSSLYTKSYLSNFKASRNREPVYDYKTRDNSGKNNMVSYAVLLGAALFFICLAVAYLGMKSDTSLSYSGYVAPSCEFANSKAGVNCVKNQNNVKTALDLLDILKPELHRRAVAYRCADATMKPQMTEEDVVTFCVTNYKFQNRSEIMIDLRNLEVLTFFNPEWGLGVAQSNSANEPIHEEHIVKNMEQVMYNINTKVTSLVILNPQLPYRCSLYNLVTNAIFAIMLVGIIFTALYLVGFAFKIYRNYQQQQKNEVNNMVERIIDILQMAATEDSGDSFVVINHVRDMILNVKERKAKQKCWEKAVNYINENESRVRTEVQTVHGESFDVWRWIGSANLSMSGSPRKNVWQGQAFDTHPGSANSPSFSPTPCLKVRGMVDEGAGLNASAAREAVLSKVAHCCRVLHCQAEAAGGCVYLKCGDSQDAAIAFKNLHGWWYSGQLVTVKYLRLERYQQRYPDAPSGPPYLKSSNPCD